MGAAVGIDLGTTHSVVAYVDGDGRASVVPNPFGRPVTPSLVCFRDGEVVVGDMARELQAIGEHPVASLFKRAMGEPAFSFRAGGREYDAVELSALVLETLRRDAERHLGAPVTRAVITVPAYFRNPQREATIEAGRRAGLEVLQVINEPTAAALAYAGAPWPGGEHLLVYDLGGGTFDVTLLRRDADGVRVLTSDGDHELGGKDWDDRIVEFLASEFRTEFGVDPLESREARGALLLEAEQAKKRLTSMQTTPVAFAFAGERGRYALDRDTFARLTRDLMERTVSLTAKVLRSQDLAPGAVDGVLLVGGSTRMPMVAEFVARVFGRLPLAGINVDEAVALGAARVAAERDGTLRFALGGRAAVVVDVTNHSLGMIAVNADGSAYLNSIILPKDAVIPSVETRPYAFRTRRHGASDLEVFLTQGETTDPADVAYLGRYLVHDVPRGERETTVVDVRYRHDVSGTVQVEAQARGADLRVTREPLPSDVPARFLLPPVEAVPQQVTAYLAFDLSGSMSGEPLEEARKAAQGFLERTDLSHCSLGIIAFSDRVAVKQPACQDARALEAALRALRVGETGGGNAGHPFDEIARVLEGVDGPRFAVVLADGVWQGQAHAVARARACHTQGIEVVAIGFGGADRAFLRDIASSDEGSFFTTLGGLVETFCSIAQVIAGAGGLAPPAVGAGRSGGSFLSRLRSRQE
jgi:molecular chaperone DnaK